MIYPLGKYDIDLVCYKIFNYLLIDSFSFQTQFSVTQHETHFKQILKQGYFSFYQSQSQLNISLDEIISRYLQVFKSLSVIAQYK